MHHGDWCLQFRDRMISLPTSLIAGAPWAVHPGIVFILRAFLSLRAINAFLFLQPAAIRTWGPTRVGNYFASSMIPRTAFSTSAAIFSMPALGKNSTIDVGS